MTHALVLPDKEFDRWVAAARPYLDAFERVAVVRSPNGNNLNRFREVTAVQVPKVWMNDNAYEHIKEIYPMVVRIDVIAVDTPEALARVLAKRIAMKDRFGEKFNTPKHIFDRFVLDYPTDYRPARIIKLFGMPNSPTPHEGIELATQPGSLVKAGASGQVLRVIHTNDALNYGAYVQISSTVENQTYLVIYAGLQNIQVSNGQMVLLGATLGQASGDSIKIVVQNPPNGIHGFQLNHVIDPTLLLYWEDLRVRPTVANLRVRSKPGTFGDTIGIIKSTDLLEVQERHGRVLEKVGVRGKWIRLVYPVSKDAFSAASYLEAVGADDPVEAIPGVPIPGVNLDNDHHLGKPDASLLKKLGWARLLYNVSLNPTIPEGNPQRYGNTNLNFTFERYRPLLEAYHRAGLKIIIVFTHQTFGEGQGYVWHQMDSGRWQDLAKRFSEIVGKIARQFAHTGLVYAYQIWNEQDTPPEHARAAVPMPANEYANLLAQSISAIRQADSSVKIITGGHASGPGTGVPYAQKVMNLLPSGVQPDGIAFHPYGRGPVGHMFSPFGDLGESIRRYAQVLPNKPVWITEWGVLDRQGDDSIANSVRQYADGFLKIIRTNFPGKVACAIWYAWADTMDNGYGLVKSNGQARQPLYDFFLK
ncbi:MAG: hypothetical protein CUN56_07815 [Phototrophicales bacterium]|nr:MAG: hypothetical protein CUN56_07815 [Phototrophicales bacterium]RMG69726.1 MAG: hypothetical protein D6711_18940 [Chloroflexota bacterium]